jgi:sugar phosphate isomerase/epimerase
MGVKLEVARDLKIPTIQLHAPSKQVRTGDHARAFLDRLKEFGVTLTAVFGGFDGEDYGTIESAVRTVGLIPSATRAARTQEMKEIADFARLLGVDVAALHIGFVPHETDSDDYRSVVAVAREICDHCKNNGQNLHLETGQESADGLLRFLGDVDRDNLFVNFDPANMILYGTGDPIAALRKVGSYVRSVHCKDALWSDLPGKEWGQEVPLGDGQVGVETYLRTLNEIGYAGPLTIEREIPQEPDRQKAEIGRSVELLERLSAELA